MSSGDSWGQKEEQEDTASSAPRREQRWGSREEKLLNSGLSTQGSAAMMSGTRVKLLVPGTSLPVALPAGGGGGGVFDGGAAT